MVYDYSWRSSAERWTIPIFNASENYLYKIIFTLLPDSIPCDPSDFKRPCNYNGPIQIIIQNCSCILSWFNNFHFMCNVKYFYHVRQCINTIQGSLHRHLESKQKKWSDWFSLRYKMFGPQLYIEYNARAII